MSKSIPIGELARRTGCRVVTIRYYERIGMLPKPARSEGGHRLYELSHLERLTFIRKARELGFSLDAVRSLMALSGQSPASSCAEIDKIATAQVAEVRSKIANLQALEATLERLLDQCQRKTIEECRILDAFRAGTTCDVDF